MYPTLELMTWQFVRKDKADKAIEALVIAIDELRAKRKICRSDQRYCACKPVLQRLKVSYY